MKLLKIMKKFILSIFAALLLVSCETDAPTKLYRVITEDNDTTYINAFRWEIYGDSKQYIIFYQTVICRKRKISNRNGGRLNYEEIKINIRERFLENRE